ncbi:MAG TPA: DUF1653 domain-containing protein [Lachnospiraceae bacterium]|nr:DUF1653 domain-containing protein [uncultured Lachnoclostridium sp.]HAU88166.1 DUF1653 domain-containing protein [Lachnospiraceae bacterium]
MKEREIPKSGEFYRHFKMKYYQIVTVATHTETREQMVIYQALYDDFGIYARPLSMFMSKVDFEKYPDAVQTYRFERVDRPCVSVESLERVQRKVEREELKETITEHKMVFEEKKISEEKRKPGEEAYVLDQEVERFLDAKTYKEKLNILMSLRNDITDKQLHDMAITLDVTIEDGNVDDKFMNLVNCLKTMARFEVDR